MRRAQAQVAEALAHVEILTPCLLLDEAQIAQPIAARALCPTTEEAHQILVAADRGHTLADNHSRGHITRARGQPIHADGGADHTANLGMFAGQRGDDRLARAPGDVLPVFQHMREVVIHPRVLGYLKAAHDDRDVGHGLADGARGRPQFRGGCRGFGAAGGHCWGSERGRRTIGPDRSTGR